MANSDNLIVKIDKSRVKNGFKVTLEGCLDADTATVLSEKLYPLIKPGIRMILDMKEIDFVNSPGWGTLVILAKEVNSNEGRIAIYNTTPSVEKIYTMLCLSPILPHFSNEESAVKYAEK